MQGELLDVPAGAVDLRVAQSGLLRLTDRIWPAVPPVTKQLRTARLSFGGAFLAAAVAAALVLPAGHGFSIVAPVVALLFVLSTRFYLRASTTSWTGCQQGAFVVLAFAMPLNLLPLATIFATALTMPRRGNQLLRFSTAAAYSSYALTATLLLALLAPGPAAWQHWPAYLAAFGGEILLALLASALVDWASGEPMLRAEAADALVVDTALTPIGLAAAVALHADAAGALVVLIGATALLALANSEYWNRRAQTDRAVRDPLTGLANRAFFSEAAGACEARCRRRHEQAALMLVDLDDFKEINDREGHVAGDRVLQAFATTLRAATRAGDTPVRLGGDEFAVILAEPMTLAGAQQVANTLSARLAAPTALADGSSATIRCSIGIALFGTDQPVAAALAEADAALYADKRARKAGGCAARGD